jgi:hypothetical protein
MVAKEKGKGAVLTIQQLCDRGEGRSGLSTWTHQPGPIIKPLIRHSCMKQGLQRFYNTIYTVNMVIF